MDSYIVTFWDGTWFEVQADSAADAESRARFFNTELEIIEIREVWA
jgi:hypothetical protein